MDEAETAARDLLARYPEVPDGWDRLGMVHEKRGETRQAADCYRRVIDFIREHADDFDADTIADYAARVAKLDPAAPATFGHRDHAARRSPSNAEARVTC